VRNPEEEWQMKVPHVLMGIGLALLLVGPAVGQPAAVVEVGPGAPLEAPPAGEVDAVEMMRQMGAGDQEIMMIQLISQAAGMDMGQAMMLMMMADQGNMDEDLMGMLLFSKMLGGAMGKQPAVLLAGDSLLIVEDGVLYKIDLAKMEVAGSVSYRPTPQMAGGLPQALMPMMQGARENVQLAACTSNMKQLVLAAMMYAQDWDGTFPSENWAEELKPYVQNTAIYACPATEGKAVGFALNEMLAAAKLNEVKDPAEIPLFFEADLPDDVAFGGADAVMAEPRHNGMIVVGFVDGHAKAMPPDALRDLLNRNPFE
jgi:prepilin-type processing-associated H-X9-DG protein